MKIKFTKLISIALVSLVLISSMSCKKKDVKKIMVDNQFAFSLFSDTMSMKDVLGMMDSTTNQWIRVKDDGSIYAYYDNFIRGVIDASDLLGTIKNTTFNTTTSFTLPEITLKYSDTLAVDKFAEFPVQFEGFGIDSVILRNGHLWFGVQLNNPISFLKEIKIFTESIVSEDGTPLAIMLDLVGTEAHCDINLKENRLIPDEEGNVSFSAMMLLDIDPGNIFQGGTYTCTLDGGISDVGFKTIYGTVETPLDSVFSKSLDINFGINGIDGDLYLPIPTVSLRYMNTFGLGTVCQINQLRLYNAITGHEANMLGTDGEVEVNILPTEGELVDEQIFGYDQQINIMDDYTSFDFSGRIAMAFDEHGQITVSDTSRIDVTGSVEMPFAIKINDLRYCDTLEVEFGSEIPENQYFDEIDFFIDTDSELKMNINMQVFFLDKNNVVTDSLFDGQHVINYGEQDEIQVIVTDQKIHNVMNAKKMILELGLSTDEISSETVHFNTNDKLALRMKMLTKTSSISLE